MNSYRNNSANLPGQAASNVFPSIQKTPYPADPFCRSLVTEWNEARIRHLENVISSKEKTVREELERRVNENFSKMYHGERTIRIDEKYF